jgi:hypothetical protein
MGSTTTMLPSSITNWILQYVHCTPHVAHALLAAMTVTCFKSPHPPTHPPTHITKASVYPASTPVSSYPIPAHPTLPQLIHNCRSWHAMAGVQCTPLAMASACSSNDSAATAHWPALGGCATNTPDHVALGPPHQACSTRPGCDSIKSPGLATQPRTAPLPQSCTLCVVVWGSRPPPPLPRFRGSHRAVARCGWGLSQGCCSFATARTGTCDVPALTRWGGHTPTTVGSTLPHAAVVTAGLVCGQTTAPTRSSWRPPWQ